MNYCHARKNANTLGVVAAFLFGTLPAPASAVDITNVHVFSEADSADAAACGVSGPSAVAAAESTFRQNRIGVVDQAKADYSFYISTLVAKTANICIVSYLVKLQYYRYVIPPNNKKQAFLTVELCFKNGVLTDATGTTSLRLLGKIRSAAEECISEALKE